MKGDRLAKRSTLGLSFGTAGAHNELLATIWLLRQGYEVLRNVSPHGMVDIIGIKDGIVHLFDVKAVRINADGEKYSSIKLTDGQLALGVKGLAVFPDGTCEIDIFPFPHRDIIKECPACKKEFKGHRPGQIYCQHKCRTSFFKLARVS